MELVEVNEKEYKEFTEFELNHFMHSYEWGQLMKYKNFIPHYIGLKDNNKLIATALLLEKKLFKNYKYYYCPRGYTIDYNNTELLKTFTNQLKKYVKKNKGIFVKIDPDIKRYDLDLDGNILSEETKVFKDLLNLGYKHKGFNKDFSGEQPRFTFRLNIDRPYEEIVANYHATTRKVYNKHNEYDFDLKIGDINNIDDFYKPMEETAIRENFICSPKEYYKHFYEVLSKSNMTDLYVLKLNIPKLINIYNDKIDNINNKLNELKDKETKKSKNQIKELENELTKLNKDLDYAKTFKEEEMVLSSIMTIKYQGGVWTLHGGNSNNFKHLNSNYYIYFNIIKDANKSGNKRIDFFGTCGEANPDKSNPIYGIHNFKKRLGGEYTEFIGEFDLVCNNILYKLFNILIPIRRKIIRNKIKSKR